MRWQFGGNLQPVRMICEFDWRECPSAVLNYVWSEIVTDVVDCLTNEALMWRVIAMLFVCTLLIHTIYSKARWMDETTINRENLNIVGCKVQDLELKVNILTYKMQYGTWPLPKQIQGTGIESGLRNVRLTLTNSSDRNNWLKHMLLSPTENSACLPYAKIGPRSVRCLTKLINLETKYMSSRFSREASPASHKVKSSESSSEKSIKYEFSKNSLELIKTDKNFRQNSENLTNVPKYSPKSSRRDTNNCWSETQVLNYKEQPKLLSRQQRSYGKDLNVSKKISPTTKKSDEFVNYSSQLCNSAQGPNRRDHKKSLTKPQNSLEHDETKFPSAPRKSEIIDKSPEERVNSTQETLYQVTQKLENLHSVLRIYGSSECAKNTHDEDCSNKELAESILQDLKNIGNLPNESESDGKTSATLPQLLDSNTEESQVTKDEEGSTSDFEQCQSDQNSSSAQSLENSYDIQNTDFFEASQSNNMVESSETTELIGKNSEISHVESANLNTEKNCSPIISQESSCTEISSLTMIPSLESPKEEEMKIEQLENEKEFLQTSFASSQADASKESNIKEKSNAALLQEAIKFKKALLTQIELENDQNNVENNRLLKSEESEGESDESWPKVRNNFQSKLLDIISEEQSASSSTEKSSKPPSLPNAFAQPQRPDELKLKKNYVEVSNNVPENSKLPAATKSSEYFSLSNLEEKMLAQDVVSSTAKDTLDTSSDFTEDESSEANEAVLKEENHALQKNITDLVNRSVQNIREYIEVFSKMQNDAILETKKAIDKNLTNASDNLKDCSSDDSIMHFVNTVAIVDSMSEELPKELPELAINSLVDFEAELSEGEQENWNYKPDYALRRRPGSISLTEQNSTTNIQEISSGALDSRSGFESALSEAEEDNRKINEPENLPSEPSCKELVMDYLLESDSDFTDGKLINALNLIEFEEDNEVRGKDDETKTLDSPLTGRTVIRATSSLTTNLESESTSLDRSYNADFEEIENSSNLEEEKTICKRQSIQHDEIFDLEQFSNFETKCEESTSSIVDLVENLPEDTWITENVKSVKMEQPERNFEENGIDAKDSVINESLTEFAEFLENKGKNLAERPNSGDTVIIKNSHDISSENEGIQSKANLSSDTSGTYMDADSRDFLNSSGISLAFDKLMLNSNIKAESLGISKSARGSNSSPLQQRIPWNAPKKGSSLNNATAMGLINPEKTKSKPENSKISKTKGVQSKPTRSQSGGNQLKVQSNFSLSASKDLESTIITSGRRAGKSNVDLPERRSRSFTTPRKTESSPRNSSTSQQDVPRVSRARKESEKIKICIEKSANSQKPGISKKESSQKSELSKTDKISQKPELPKKVESLEASKLSKKEKILQDSKKSEKQEFSNKSEKNDFSDKSEKSMTGISAGSSFKSCVTKTSSKSCIPLLKSRIRAKSPMRGPLTMSTSSWREENLRTPNSALENIQAEGNVARNEENSFIIQSPEPCKVIKKNEVKSLEKLPETRTVIYVNIVTEQEHTTTRVVDPKKFLEYLKDRELKIQSVLDQEIGAEGSLVNNSTSESCSSPRILTVVSSAADGKISSDGLQQNRVDSNNSALTGSWSLRVEQKEIEVSAKPSVMDMSTSISDLPEISAESRGNLEKFQIFEVPKELTKDEYIVLLEALNQDPNLHQLREMHKLCNKLGLGFHE